MAKITLMLHLQPLFEFVLPTTVAVAQLHIHYVEYSAMCNCASQEVQTSLFTSIVATSNINKPPLNIFVSLF